jgi:MtN3 and saliva related transmembrane protein
MPVFWVDIAGFAAATLTTLAFVPQVVQTWRSRSANDLSTATLVAFTAGVLLWLVYGVAVDAWPIVIANAITLGLSGLLLVLKLRAPATPPQ